MPRLEGHAKVTGRAEYIHNLACRACSTGRSSAARVAHGRIRRIDTSAARAVAGVHSVVTGEDILRLSPIRTTGRRSTISRSSRSRRCAMSASRSRSCSPPTRTSRRKPRSSIVAEYEELPAVFDEVEAMTSKAIVHEVLKPAGTFPDLKHLEGRRDTNVALDFHLRRGDVEQAASRRPITCSSTAFRRSRCCTCRWSRSSRSPSRRASR